MISTLFTNEELAIFGVFAVGMLIGVFFAHDFSFWKW